MTMNNNEKDNITNSEIIFLKLAYNRFLSIYKELTSKEFWSNAPNYRLMTTREAFSVYVELLQTKSIKKLNQKIHCPDISQVENDVFKFIRNYLSHFPFFDSWDDIWIQKDLINWQKPNQSMDKFLKKYEGANSMKYRYRELESNFESMTYISINFPDNYTNNEKFFLREILTEKEGIIFSIIYMWGVLSNLIKWEK